MIEIFYSKLQIESFKSLLIKILLIIKDRILNSLIQKKMPCIDFSFVIKKILNFISFFQLTFNILHCLFLSSFKNNISVIFKLFSCNNKFYLKYYFISYLYLY